MDRFEMSEQFDLLFNNITSNQAPGLDEFEKSAFLTKAEKEIVKNYFSSNSKGNNLQQGFDDSAKRQADFSTLLVTKTCTVASIPASIGGSKLDSRSKVYKYPDDVFIVINETIALTNSDSRTKLLQVIPLRYDEYTREMSKNYKRPLKNQAWKLMNSGLVAGSTSTKYVEIIVNSWDESNLGDYSVRFIKTPPPILLADFSADGLSIDGQSGPLDCVIDPILHEDIVQRAVELAKVAWTQTGGDNTQAVLAAGQRIE